MSEAKNISARHTQPKSRPSAGHGPGSGSFTVARVQVQELSSLAGHQVVSAPATDILSDELIVDRVLAGEGKLYELLMRRHNARVFRIVRGIAGSDAEAEDVMQEAYVRAFENLAGFEKRARFSTWLTRIAIHEALARLRRGRVFASELEQCPTASAATQASSRTPEQGVSDRELARMLEAAIDELPEDFRLVFTLRALDQMSVADVAEVLGVLPETVKTRYFRARLRLRRALITRFDDAEPRAFDLPISRCNWVVAAVFDRVGIAG